MDEAEAKAEWVAKQNDSEFRRRSAETSKLAMSMAKMTSSYCSAFDGEGYAYLPITILCRILIVDGHARPEALEIVGHPEVPNGFIADMLSAAAQSMGVVGEAGEYTGEVFVSSIQGGPAREN